MTSWIDANKSERPFEAGALAYIKGHERNYGCHFGMRSTVDWCRERFGAGWDAAQRDCASSTATLAPVRYWTGNIASCDDFGDNIDDCFIDGATVYGPWAIMSPKSHRANGRGLGTGLGQKYKRQSDGRWLKVEG